MVNYFNEDKAVVLCVFCYGQRTFGILCGCCFSINYLANCFLGIDKGKRIRFCFIQIQCTSTEVITGQCYCKIQIFELDDTNGHAFCTFLNQPD